MSGKLVETDLDKGVFHNSEWVQRWIDGDIGFHQNVHDSFLDRHEEEMFGGKTKSVFLPLCGKSPDIYWMYTHGHTVCGVEIAENAVKDFFDENNIDYNTEMVKDVGKVYKSKDDRLRILAADIFDLSPELIGQFDVIWDSKSFVAINKSDRTQYCNLLLSLMKKDGLYYLSTMEYDPTVWPGPPHSVPDEVVKNVYSAKCSIVTVGEDALAMSKMPSPSTDGPTKMPESDKAMAAVRNSSYFYFRWYKLTFEQLE